MKHFTVSIIFTLACLGLAFWWGFSRGGMAGALQALGIATILAIMEVSLSFDNAVVNASVLKTWNKFWQNLFLGLGIIIAVFGMRLLFPLLIVALAADLGLVEVWNLALNDPERYSAYLTDHHAEVAAFGGVFLLLVFLNFLFDDAKEMHWLGALEAKLSALGRLKAIAVLITLVVLLLALALVPDDRKLIVLISGMWGLVTYLGVDVVSNLLEGSDSAATSDSDDAVGAGAVTSLQTGANHLPGQDASAALNVGKLVKGGSIGGFLYLEVLDASFSFDGVIGAFAITKDVVIIMLGLAIGAMFVRSITVYLVRKGTLDEFVYLEHGAHYAIGVLAVIMLLSMKYHIPELFTGLIGVALVLAALWSSIRWRKAQASSPVKI